MFHISPENINIVLATKLFIEPKAFMLSKILSLSTHN